MVTGKLSAMSVKPGVTAPVGDHVPKTELVGCMIAFSVIDYAPDEPGEYGRQPRVDVDLLVVDGAYAGTRDDGWRTWGNLARQMGEQGEGTIAARVTSGPGKAQGSKWYGLDFELTVEEIQQIKEAVLSATTSTPKTKTDEPKSNGSAKRAPAAKQEPVADSPVGHSEDPPF